MKLTFKNKKISGIATVLAPRELRFEEEMHNYKFSEKKCLRLKEVMGFNKHRLVDESTCASDLCVSGMEQLFENGKLKREDIDALIFVSQSPDYFLPPTSSVIQGRLELKTDMFCMDINQGCAGFLIGLFQSFMMLENEEIKKVVLLNADTLSRKCSPQDRNIYPMVGDAAAVTIVENSQEDNVIYANLKMDGTRSDALQIPAGGYRLPASEKTAELEDVGGDNLRSKNHLHMTGTAIFNFVQTEVPPMINDMLEHAGREMNDVDYFMCHQPNKFMLQKLADKMKIDYEQMPNNIVENFGNASGVTIPTNICFNLGDRLVNEAFNICLAGFGVGLTWSSMLMRMGPLDFCELMEMN
jgi:3-oxoacyl-[acyl-carrier-protein] synthase-3